MVYHIQGTPNFFNSNAKHYFAWYSSDPNSTLKKDNPRAFFRTHNYLERSPIGYITIEDPKGKQETYTYGPGDS